MSQLLGTVLASQITTGDTANTFSIGDTNLMQGGQHSVTVIEERDAITTERRREGMTCWVAGTINLMFHLEGGTNNTNWIAQVAPALATLPDVSIPSPTTNQVLSFDGSLWVAADTPSQVAPGAFTYFLENVASGTDSYFTLLSSPSGTPEDQDTVFVGGSIPYAPLDGYISGTLSRTIIGAGIWEFNTYASVSTFASAANVVVDIYTRDISGAETYLFSGTSGNVVAIAPQLVTSIVTTGSYFTALTDKLVAKYAFARTGTDVVAATFYHSGSAHNSHFHTPIGYAHNNLDGLQGGNSTNSQFFHTTLDQNAALAGNSGNPSAYNPYVTVAGLNVQTGTVTNIAWSAYGIAVSGSTTANDAYALAQQLAAELGVSFQGTISLFTSYVRYGKPDTAFTLINGIVAGRQDSKFVWEDFEYYGTTTGTTPVTGMDQGTSWNGNGSIYTNSLVVGVAGTDLMNLYPTGTITSTTLNQGTGWTSSGTSWGDTYWFRFLGTDTFESYSVGTLSSSGTEMNGGGGWVGTAQCYSGSNRP